MSCSMLIAGLNSLFDLKLLKEVYRKNNIYTEVVTRKDNYLLLKKQIHESNKYLVDNKTLEFFDRIKILDNDDVNNENKSSNFYGWFFVKSFTINSIYDNEINSLEKHTHTFIETLKHCNITEVNVVNFGKQVNYNQNSMSTLVAEKLNQIQDEISKSIDKINDYCNISKVGLNMFVLPNSINVIEQESVNSFVDLSRRIFSFKEWVSSRVSDYYDTNNFYIYGKNNSVNVASFEAITDEINSLYKAKKVNTINKFNLCKDFNISMRDLIDYTNNYFNLNVVYTNSYDDLNEVDKIFNNQLTYHMPYFIEGDDSESKITDNQNKNILHEHVENTLKEYEVTKKEFLIDVEFEEKYIELNNNQKIKYYTTGKGEPVYIINAYGVAVDAWKPFISMLAKSYYVIIGEIRGIYDKDKPQNSANQHFGVYDQVDDISKIIETEKLEKFHFVSWCSGVKQALIYSSQNNNKVLSQVFIAGEFAPYKESKKDHSKFRDSVQEIYEIIKDDDRLFTYYLKIINKNIFTKSVNYQELLDKASYIKEKTIESFIYQVVPEKDRKIILGAFSTKEKMRNFLRMCVEYYQHDVENLISNTSIPVLLVSAEKDNIANANQSKWAHSKFINSVHICLPEASHSIVKERHYDVFNCFDIHMQKNF